ncbi:MAG: hypothetical protein ACOZE7_08530 [Pseudomonadota bacterium]
MHQRLCRSEEIIVENRSVPVLKSQLLSLLDDVLAHDGFGTIRIDVRLLKRGQKEVILDCGKQYRFVVDFPAPESAADTGHRLTLPAREA